MTKILVHLRLTLTQPYQTSSSWTFSSLQFRWKFICLHVFRQNYMTSYFGKWPSPGLNKQSWCWKIFSLLNILTWHSHTTSSDWFLLSSRSCYNFDHLHVLSRKSHDVDFCLWLLSECNTKLWMLQPVVGLGLGGPEARLKRGPSDDVIIISQPW